MAEASENMQKYFDGLRKKTLEAYELAKEARKKGYDPVDEVEISLAENMAERVVGLISILAPQIVGSGVVNRIIALEEEYGSMNWRVGFKIAEEIAKQQFCKFDEKKMAIEIGIRTGFAYVTSGVVSSPLDGLIDITLKDRLDGGGQYFCLNFAGPIRNAGGTAASVCCLIADYVRKKMDYATYDATDEEAKRAHVEVMDYIERCAPRQHTPCEEEMFFLMKNMPIEISGDPSERFEVSNFKDLPRIPTNIIRSGFCLVMSDCIPLKSPKLWKQLDKWGDSFDMSHWGFLPEFIKIQKAAKSKGASKTETKGISPNYTYVKEIVAGRPVLGYPLRSGGFRLRYGRSRFSGLSAQSMHPATMAVLHDYIGTGSQLKTERPGKAASMTTCDSIDGPIVKLENGDICYLSTLEEAQEIAPKIEEIIYLGDILAPYGDFLNRAHPLVPVGYCQEWWAREIEAALGDKSPDELAAGIGMSIEEFKQLLYRPMMQTISIEKALYISKETGVPLHSDFTFYYDSVTPQDIKSILPIIDTAEIQEEPYTITLRNVSDAQKRIIELLGICHIVGVQSELVITGRFAKGLYHIFHQRKKPAPEPEEKETGTQYVNRFSTIKLRDKGGTFIGTRMGRPEKAKMRKMNGSPHMSFPIGDEGGRLRCIQSALDAKVVTADWPQYHCSACDTLGVFRRCDSCDGLTKQKFYCRPCEKWSFEETCAQHGTPNRTYNRRKLEIRSLFKNTLKRLGMRSYPDLIKGVRGTTNRKKIPEHIAKGILRAKRDVYVFKDGTTRYDMSQLPMTHFKPKEVGTSVEKLIELGYTTDVYGKELTHDDQVLELFPQDLVLPTGIHAGEDGCDKVMGRVAQFVNDLLTSLYRVPEFYGSNLIGELVIALAPHTSAGIVGRIIGYSNTQGMWAHPFIHAAVRRDCDGDEACVILMMDAFLNFSRNFLPSSRGGTMDAPLVLTTLMTPAEVDDMAFDVDTSWNYPLEMYMKGLEYAKPWDVKVPIINHVLGTPAQFEGMGYTHETSDMNTTISCSAYKTVPSMALKLEGQMRIAEQVRAVDTVDVASLVIERHFMRDSLGNLRQFTQQKFRCIKCNEKFRRIPLVGKCTACSGRIIFTVSKGNICKYVQPTLDLAQKYHVSKYLQQTIELLQRRVEGLFGRDKEKQLGLGVWFG
jgi:DNA polymerase II large subunit